jgi:hypothetical protein
MLEVFKLLGTIAINNSDANKEIDETANIAGKAKDKINGAFGKIGSAAVTVGKTITAGLVAGATAIGALTKASIESYAEYEQLVGGVETLFKDSSDVVMKYAENAYKTAGMSANNYMETVTSFSASLLQGLGGDTAAAAEYADMAITDMSDNANKMGTDISMIQNAYQGFAKQNYTMLDNLKLGYGGTQAEMARLINDSGVLGDTITVTAETVNQVSFSKIIEAIHVMQDEMGITGTTAREASETIAGSVASMKSAWENLLTGIADENADFEKLVEDFVETVGITANNIIPRVEIALNGAGKLVDKMVPIIIDKVPTIVTEFLPKIMQSGVDIIESLLEGIVENQDEIADGAVRTVETLIDGIIDLLPEIIVTGVLLIGKLAVGLIEAIPDLVAKIPEIINSVVDGFANNAVSFIDIGKRIVNGIWEGIQATWSMLVNNFSWLTNGLMAGVSGAVGAGVGDSTLRNATRIGSHADGLDYVPYDGYIAELHKGEMVVPAAESKFLRSGAIGVGTGEVVSMLERILYALQEGNTANMSLELNHREFARLVKAVN